MSFTDNDFKAARNQSIVHRPVPASSDNRQNIRIRECISRKNHFRDLLFLNDLSNIVNTSENFNPQDFFTYALPVEVDESNNIITVINAGAKFSKNFLAG